MTPLPSPTPTCAERWSLHGWPAAWGSRPITGGELTLTDGTRLVLLARTRRGYGNLSRLFTLANSTWTGRSHGWTPSTCPTMRRG